MSGHGDAFLVRADRHASELPTVVACHMLVLRAVLVQQHDDRGLCSATDGNKAVSRLFHTHEAKRPIRLRLCTCRGVDHDVIRDTGTRFAVTTAHRARRHFVRVEDLLGHPLPQTLALVHDAAGLEVPFALRGAALALHEARQVQRSVCGGMGEWTYRRNRVQTDQDWPEP